MCGIIGYIGNRDAQSILIKGLHKLEYRGYDSAGIATLYKKHKLGYTCLERSVGNVLKLEKLLIKKPCLGSIGIAHTRWATHGNASKINAHPHYVNGISIVHNGIIENHFSLKKKLIKNGSVFKSNTDSEIFAHLISIDKKHDLFSSVKNALSIVKGSYALVVLDEKNPDIIVCSSRMLTLVIGFSEHGNFVTSDFSSILSYTNKFIFLEDGDVAILRVNNVEIRDINGKLKQKSICKIDSSPSNVEKGCYKHFMYKEILEQPSSIYNTLYGRISENSFNLTLKEVNLSKLSNINRIIIVACGTSYHAGLVAKYQIENIIKIPIEVELASEFRYRKPYLTKQSLVIAVSQSGETADTYASMKFSKLNGAHICSVCNVIGSSLTRLSSDDVGTIYTKAGFEISVASTKSFVTQIVALNLLGLYIAKNHCTIINDEFIKRVQLLLSLPELMRKVFSVEKEIIKISKTLVNNSSMICLGRGALFPIALEGALKIKELSYIHAEGYACGEIKHGLIALVDENMPIIVFACHGFGYNKTIGNINEIKSRNGKVIVICNEDDMQISKLVNFVIKIPRSDMLLTPIIAVLPLQILSYYLACFKGVNVDQPRNLAKSVTVD